MPQSSFRTRSVLFRCRLKRRRFEANLTQKTLSARLNRPQSFVAKYESGERRLDVMEFIEVADAIGFDPAVFIRELRAFGDDAAAQRREGPG